MRLHSGKTALVLVALWSGCAYGQPNPTNSAPAQDPAQIVQFLSQAIEWHRQLAVEQQLAKEPADLAFLQGNRQVADQVVQLAFEYARTQAQLQAKQPTPKTQTTANGSNTGQYQRLFQLAQQTEQQINDTQTELQQTRDKLAGAAASKRKLLQSQVAELESEIGLLQARRDAVESMIEFVNSSSSGGKGAGLRAQIEELARSVPGYLSQPEGTAAQQSQTTSAAAATRTPEPAGIWGLSADLLHLMGKVHTLNAENSGTASLKQLAAALRKPIIDYMRSLIHQGDQLFAAADTAGAAQLGQQKQQLDALTNQFKQTSSQMLPLSKISVLLDLYQRNLSNWKETVRERERDDLRELSLDLGILIILIAAVFAVGEIWRRTTFRYIRDTRRRYQFMLLRRVVMWVAVALIVVLAFASQLGSAVTFAGLLTAGVAVALQNVIVSVVAYFFLIGKYGIRVGDRVQIAGVTGEVVDIGLVRIHVMELGGPGDSQPTGRIVAFSNSIVFQPTAGVFKQIPGTNFIWHELKLTLAPESDYHEAKERITKAVDAALDQYRESIENQRLVMEKNLSTISPAELRPRIRLHYTAAGIEASVRFPVELEKASEMDDHLMKEVTAALAREPKLKLIGAEMPMVKAG
jgi:small-conductance mechanosensitive channel